LNPISRTPAVSSFLRSAKNCKLPYFWKTAFNQKAESSEQLDPSILDCRVRLTKQESNTPSSDAFTVEICGSIHAPSDMHYTTVQILLSDVTDGPSRAQLVHSRLKQWQMQDSPVFCYNADLGKLPQQLTILSDWMVVARINLDWLIFPRRGQRNLQFGVSILSRDSSEELARAACNFTCENNSFGYKDLQENICRIRTLAVALAFAVSAADKKLYNCEVELIKNWARANFDFSKASDKAKHKLEKALNETVCFFRDGNQLDTDKICKEIVEIAPLADRYEILELCLRVAQANGTVAVEEITLLRKLARWLKVDPERFRTMMVKILPASMYEVKNRQVLLGVTLDMGKDEARRQLNKEYRKWNARVTNFNREIQAQADHMLNLITEARSQYVR